MPKLEGGVGFYDDEAGISRDDMEFLLKETEYDYSTNVHYATVHMTAPGAFAKQACHTHSDSCGHFDRSLSVKSDHQSTSYKKKELLSDDDFSDSSSDRDEDDFDKSDIDHLFKDVTGFNTYLFIYLFIFYIE